MKDLSPLCREEIAAVLVALEEDGPSAFPESELRVSRSRGTRRILVTRIEPRHRVYRGYERL
jgi:hypothetical protein